MARLEEISAALKEAGLDGWLLYDFRLSDPLAYRILGMPETGLATRRWFYFIRADGTAQALASAVEAHRLDAAPAASKTVYRSAHELRAGLEAMLRGARRVAMNYSPQAAIPYVSRVDGGTLELIRATGVAIVSAADLIQRFEATLTGSQLAGHRRAARHLRDIVDEAFAEITRRVRYHLPCSEFSIQKFVLGRIVAHGLRTDEAPIVAVNANAANPHFSPAEQRDTPIRAGDLILIDLFAKEPDADSIYGDLTWMGCAAANVPDAFAQVFRIVAQARDTAVELIQGRVAESLAVSGEEADRAARRVIENAGYGDNFVHRTGHSIGREVHGTGANLDSLETHDHRQLIERTCFSVEPGIYLQGRFGIRSELDMVIEDGIASVSGGPPQQAIIPLFSRYAG